MCPCHHPSRVTRGNDAIAPQGTYEGIVVFVACAEGAVEMTSAIADNAANAGCVLLLARIRPTIAPGATGGVSSAVLECPADAIGNNAVLPSI